MPFRSIKNPFDEFVPLTGILFGTGITSEWNNWDSQMYHRFYWNESELVIMMLDLCMVGLVFVCFPISTSLYLSSSLRFSLLLLIVGIMISVVLVHIIIFYYLYSEHHEVNYYIFCSHHHYSHWTILKITICLCAVQRSAHVDHREYLELLVHGTFPTCINGAP